MSHFGADSRIVDHVRPSPSHDTRSGGPIDILLLHYTGMASTEAAIARLCEPSAKVSSHYVVDEAGEVLQLVPEERRAWHAGVSSWEGTTDINTRSLGIEIANPGHSFGYPDFTEAQIAAVIALGRDIVARHQIRPYRVLAHSDVAPLRKTDPGEKFPWERLYQAGIGAWIEPSPIIDGEFTQREALRGDMAPDADIVKVQGALKRYGYGVELTGVYDALTEAVVTAFQRHFRPARVDGRADHSTVATLEALLAAHNEKNNT